MAKPIKRRRGLSGRNRTYISRSELRFISEHAQRMADAHGETWHVIRWRSELGSLHYSTQPTRFVHRLLDGGNGYIAMTFPPTPTHPSGAMRESEAG